MRKHLIVAAALAALIPAASSANTAAAPAVNVADPAANAVDPAMADPAANTAIGPDATAPAPTDPAATGGGSDLALRGTENRRQRRDGFPWGLLGLIGLAGLIPIKRRNPNEAA